HYEGGFEPASAIRSGDWKLIEFYEESRVELYNLKEDIGEYNDLANTHPEITKKLRIKLHAWRKKVNASEPTPNPNFNPYETQNYRIGYKNLFKDINEFKVKNN
ncbi:MAG: DUF4976 domain-containing protein, partial [Flavobacteriaceae bacterium]|nr:DUF4976 domain-containing protein [Flavobacteriaceae bacterium]